MRQKWRVVLGVAMVFPLLAGQWYHMKLYTQTQSSRHVVQSRKADETAAEQQKEGEHKKKTAYLTFDDGPSVLTEKYLDILWKHHAKATFFLIGQQIQGDMKEIVRREIKEGHEVGIHTYTHVSGEIYQSADAYYQDVYRVKELLQKEFQYKPSILRFPWGSANCYICHYKQDIVNRLREEGIEYTDWNVSGEDSVGRPDSSTILANIRKDCFQVDEPVILLHDSSSNQATLNTLETVITMLEQEGYGFGTISEREKNCHFGEYN